MIIAEIQSKYLQHDYANEIIIVQIKLITHI